MQDVPDFDLRETPDEPPAPHKPPLSAALWIIAALLIAVLGVSEFIVLRDPPPATPPTGSTSEPVDEAPSEVRAPLGGKPMPVTLPSLDGSDALVRKLVAALSSHPRVAAWLATDGLVRNFTVVVTNIAEGETPAIHLPRLRPSARFQVIERNGDQSIDPRSYERYATLAAAAMSIDPAGSARLYATLKPLIEEAHRELGYAKTPFDRTLERAIVRLLSTPILHDPVRVVPQGLGYAFADPEVEALTAAQKQLLRFGPRNVRLIQETLRNIGLALGIPAQRLPVTEVGGR